MRAVRLEDGDAHMAQIGGPKLEVLIDDRREGGVRFAAAHALGAPDGKMSKHAHGESEALALPQSGRVVTKGGGRREILEPNTLALIGIGERVRLEKPSPQELISLRHEAVGSTWFS